MQDCPCDRYFRLKEHGTDVRTEILAGITTFLSCAYILFVNPSILANSGMPPTGVATATALVSAVCCLGMGLYANNPIALAPGMGLNAFFAFSVVLGMKLSWQEALGLVFWSGVLLTIMSFMNIREKIIDAIPHSLRYATSCGIGLFIAVIGLMNAGIITDHPATLVTMGKMGPAQLTFVAGLLFSIALLVRGVKGALLWGILGTILMAAPLGRLWGQTALVSYHGAFAAPDFSTFFALDWGAGLRPGLWPVLFAMMFTDLFDSLSTFVGVAEAGKLMGPDGRPRNVRKSLIVDSIATMISGPLGTSSATSYIESATGVQQGGRTGLTATVTGLLFLPFIFLAPLVSVVPALATAPALVLVGVFMMSPIAKINWDKPEEAAPAFLNLLMIPMGYSITQGIVWGFLSYTFIKIVKGEKSSLTPTLLIIDALAIISVALH